MHVKTAGCVAGMLVGCFAAAAQSSTPPGGTPTFKSEVHLVSVPVVVRDRDGKVVEDLKQDQFELFDNGKKREITSFSIEQPAGEQEAKNSANPPQRFTAWVFDDLGISNETDVKQLRDSASAYFSQLSPGDRVAIFTTSCRISQNFTNEKEKLLAAVSKIEFKPLGLCRVPRNETVQLVELKSLAKNMATLPGQRSIVFVSPGVGVPNDEFIRRQIDPTDLAVQNKVLINTVHLTEASPTATGSGDLMAGGPVSRGVQQVSGGTNPNNQADQQISSNSRDSRPIEMIQLSDGTGGEFIESGNDFARAFREMSTPQCIYLLGFPLDEVKANGKFHRLKVTVNDSRKLNIQMRNGFFAPKPGEKLE